MTIDITSLAIKVTSEGIQQATKDLNALVEASSKVDKQSTATSKSTKSLEDSQKASASAIEKLLEKFQKQVDLLGANTSQTNSYTAAIKGATDEQRRSAQMLGAEVDAYKSLSAAQTEAYKQKEILQKRDIEMQRIAAKQYTLDHAEAIAMNKALGESETARSIRLSEMTAASMARMEAARAETLASSSIVRTGSGGPSSLATQMTPSITRDETAAAKAITDAEKLKVANAELETSFQKIMKVADPYGSKLIANSQAMDVLTQSHKAGLIGINEYEAGMKRLLTIRDSTLAKELHDTEKAANAAGIGLSNFSMSSARAKTETIVLAREMASGNWSRFAGSFSIWIQQVGLFGAALALISNPLTYVAGAVAGLGVAAVAADLEIEKLNRGLISSGNASGTTAGQILKTAEELTTVTISASKATGVLSILASSGVVSGSALKNMGSAALNLAEMTGQSADKVAKDFAGMGDKVVEFADKHLAQYNLVSTAVYEHISALERQGKTEEAQNVLSESVAQETAKRLEAIKDTLSTVQTSWEKVGSAAAGAWDKMKSTMALAVGLAPAQQELESRLAAKNGASGGLLATALGDLGSTLFKRAKATAYGAINLQAPDYSNAPLVSNDERIKTLQAEITKAEAAAKLQEAADKTEREGREGLKGLNSMSSHIDKAEKLSLGLAKIQKQWDDLNKADPGLKHLQETDPTNFLLKPNALKTLMDDERKKVMGGRAPRTNEYAIDAEIEKQKGLYAEEQQSLAQHLKDIRTQYDVGVIDTKTFLLTTVQAKEESLGKQYLIAQKEYDIAEGKKNVKAREVYANLMKKIEGEMLNTSIQYGNDAEELDKKRQASIDNYTLKLQEVYDLRQKEINSASDIAGMGTRQQQEFTTRLKLEEKFTKDMDALQKRRNLGEGARGGIGQEEYDIEAAAATKFYNAALLQEREYNANSLILKGDWKNGATRALDDYNSSVQDTAGQFQSAFSNAFKGAEESLKSFIMTGKLDFKSFALSVIASMAEIQAKALVGMATGAGGGGGLGGILTAIIGGAFAGSAGSSVGGLGLGASTSLSSMGGGTGISFHMASGGGVGANSFGEVNERGPEMFTSGGKDYLMTGSKGGMVTSNDKLPKGGDIKFTIVNQTTGRIDNVKEQRISDTDRALIITEAVNATSASLYDSNSKMSKGLANTHNLQRRR